MSSVSPLRTINVDDRKLQQIQQAIQDWVGEVEHVIEDPILGGVIVPKVLFPNADQDVTVAHGLGKAVQGYEVVRRNKAGLVYDSPTVSTQPTLTIILRCNISQATFDLRFF